jgi:hypothetical protein
MIKIGPRHKRITVKKWKIDFDNELRKCDLMASVTISWEFLVVLNIQ